MPVVTAIEFEDLIAPRKRTREADAGVATIVVESVDSVVDDDVSDDEVSDGEVTADAPEPLERVADVVPPAPQDDVAEPDENEDEAAPEDVAGYVPMSEWLDDFDRR